MNDKSWRGEVQSKETAANLKDFTASFLTTAAPFPSADWQVTQPVIIHPSHGWNCSGPLKQVLTTFGVDVSALWMLLPSPGQDQFLQCFRVVTSSWGRVISETNEQSFLQYLAPDQTFLDSSQVKRPFLPLCWQPKLLVKE